MAADAAGTPELSVVVPLRDEASNIDAVYRELTDVLGPLGRSYELILVEDGSRDRTFERLRDIHAADSHVRVVRFDRNYGQTAAFAAGFAMACGALVVTLDGDLQNDPADIPRLLDAASSADVVCGWRRERRDDFLTRRVPSIVANRLIAMLSGARVHDQGCSLKVFRSHVVKSLRLRPGMHRYLASIATFHGARVTEVEVHHRPRRQGQSKYGLSRTFTVFADLFRLRRLMRDAVTDAGPAPCIYRVVETLDRSGSRPA